MAEEEGSAGKPVVEKVSLFELLFTFSDKLDVILMLVGSLGAIGSGVAPPLMSILFGTMINSFASSSQASVVKSVSEVSLQFVYLAIGTGIAGFLQVSCWMIAGERQSGRIRSLYLKTILGQEVGFFDTETTTGEVIGRMSGDTILIQDAMGEKVGKFIQLASLFVCGFLVAFSRGWRLAIVLLACIPILILVGGILETAVSKMSSRGQIAYAEAGKVVDQTVGCIRTVASFTGEKQAVQKYNAKIKAAYEVAVYQGLASGVGLGVMSLVIFGTFALAMWYGAKQIIEQGYTGGQVMTVISAVMNGGMSLGQASPIINAFAAGQAAAYKMFETIKREPKIDPFDENGMVLEDFDGRIELKDVHFRYPARLDVQIFSGFSLKIPSGNTTALVGRSGSGKSTVISLIERFYDPDSGQVLIDGIDLKRMKLSWIREQIGLVSQEPILFATSIKENIAYGKENATDEEIRTAVELASAAIFLDKLPERLDTMVGDHGTQLSGGQKQRIAIARAILKSPRILLLDEATSALDAESERIVQATLMNVMQNRTTVVVAHRLTTVRTADLIAVVHEGKLVEKGTHEELMQVRDGAYTQLVRLQQGAKQPEKESPHKQQDAGTSFDRSPSVNTMTGYSIPASTIHEEGDESENADKKPRNLKRLAYLNRPEIPYLVAGGIGAAVHGIAFPAFGILLSSGISMFYEPHAKLRKDSAARAVQFVCFGIVTLIAVPVQSYFFGVAGAKLIERIRSMTFEKVVHQDINWFDDPANSSGAVGARLSTDASTVRSLVGDVLGAIVQNGTTILASLVIAFDANWILALVVLGLSPLLLIQGFMQTKFTKGFSADAKVMYEEASQVASDAVGSIRTVASFCAEKKVMNLYHKKCDGPIKKGVRLGVVSGVGFGLSFFVLYCTNALSFYIGSLLVQHGHATFAQVFRVFFALTIAALGVSQSSGIAPDAAKAKDSAASIFGILDRKPEIDSSSDEGMMLVNINGDIELEHVSFKYPQRPHIQIFKDLCLQIPSGKTVALVGESGSGKSTVISLIERFYNPDSGNIYLDSVEIKQLRLSWLRQQMGLVGQEPILFNETIRANIAYGKQGTVTEEEVITAANAANAHSFISSLPEGYDTSVGERGLQLSGGQKQRIAIARAIVKNPKILLLDEATSALDAQSERVVQDALDRVMVNRTTIVVAHRLATVKGADIIAVVKDGAIAEKGTHQVLMNMTDGAYASLVSLHMDAAT